MTFFWRKSSLAMLAAGAILGPFSASAFNESPVLVGNGLPPVAARLPTSPEVVIPLDSIGSYGGTIRRALGGSSDHNSILRFLSPQGLTRWEPDFSQVVPNVAESWSVNAEGTEFTFHLREGMRWSDGEPFTAADILFFVEDLLQNEEFYPTPPARYVIDGQPMEAEMIDETTIILSFAAPYGTFLTELATPMGQEPVLWARHYCQQFHPTYNPRHPDLDRCHRRRR